MSLIKILNRNKDDFDLSLHNYFYIGRGSDLGNPFSHLPIVTKAQYKVKSRDEAIDRYIDYIEDIVEKGENLSILQELQKMIVLLRKDIPIYLVCYCSPNSCHGDILKKLLLIYLQTEKDFI